MWTRGLSRPRTSDYPTYHHDKEMKERRQGHQVQMKMEVEAQQYPVQLDLEILTQMDRRIGPHMSLKTDKLFLAFK